MRRRGEPLRAHSISDEFLLVDGVKRQDIEQLRENVAGASPKNQHVLDAFATFQVVAVFE